MFFVQDMNDCLASLHQYSGYKNLLCIIPNVCSDLLLLFVDTLPAISQTSGKNRYFFHVTSSHLAAVFLCALSYWQTSSLHYTESNQFFSITLEMLLGTIRPSIQCKQTSFVILYPFISICVGQPWLILFLQQECRVKCHLVC